MCGDKKTDVDKFNFTFNGDYEVDAITVSSTIKNLVELMSIAAASECPGTVVRLSVSAVKQGSLDFYFNAIAESTKTLLSANNMNHAKLLLDVIVALFNVKNFLKGKRPESVKEVGDNIEVKNITGDVYVVQKGANILFSDYNVDALLSGVFSSANSSPKVSGISISDKNGPKVSIPREDFGELSVPITGLVDTPKQFTYERTDVLFIKKPDLLGETAWTFQADKQIVADIADKEFMGRIHDGEIKVSAGMSIVADMRVRYDLLDTGLPNEKTTKYTVLHVNEINYPDDSQLRI